MILTSPSPVSTSVVIKTQAWDVKEKGLFMKGTPHIHTFLEKPSLVKSLRKEGELAWNLYYCYQEIATGQGDINCSSRPAGLGEWKIWEEIWGNLKGNNSE